MRAIPRHQVFISYSHQDKEWLRKLRTMLKPLIRKGKISVWDDTHIQPSQQWRNEIKQALAQAKVAVLLVSPDFLASDFIAEEELPPLLDAAEKEGLKILWIPIRASWYEETEIEKYQAAHDPANPLASLNPAEQEMALVKIAKVIKAACEPSATEALQPMAPRPLPQKATGARLQFLKGSSVSLTRLFARPQIILGRPKLTADLWLALFPLDEPDNQTRMDSFSETHAVVSMNAQAKIRDDHSKGGTKVNGTTLKGGKWQALHNGDLISFCHEALQLRVRLEPTRWLRLDRVNDSPQVENYLFLRGTGTAMMGNSEEAAIKVSETDENHLAELSYQEGGFVIVGQNTPVTINGQSISPGMRVGLRQGDLVEVGPLLFEFQIGAYPGEQVG
ncbi:TIR protein [Nitrosococcus halophilus Nc 4]|uniref:TIR protein n=1 Tax=Nitrosococcus halophilus (strain Nc4) TaxID=472759 RepID=D5BYT2_NITHN|nr:TIR domain-containing protein [Nitrosococcus halophilus]ADE16070.1 TIR protein [Nitrosococcus halophilus Nc 4]